MSACHEIQPANATRICFCGCVPRKGKYEKENEKIKIETKLADNTLPVVAPLQQGGYSSTCNKLTASCLSTAPWLAKDQVIDIEFMERSAPAI